MINTARLNVARPAVRTYPAVAVAKEPSPVRYGIAGTLLGAVSFGTIFPAVSLALTRATGVADTLVYTASGIMFGVITGGSIGAVIGGRGR